MAHEAHLSPSLPVGRPTGRPGLRRLLSRVLTALLVVAAAGWAIALRPTFLLGGPASYVIVSGTSMEPTLHTGDLAVVRRREAYAVGDVVAYRVRPEGAAADRLIIHRIVGGSAEDGFELQGDNRERRDTWRPRPAEIQGAMIVHVPAIGTALAALQKPRLLTAGIAGALVFLVVSSVAATEPRRRRGALAADPPVPATTATAAAGEAAGTGNDAPTFLVLAHAADGYALVEQSGAPPGPGNLLVLGGRLFEVTGASVSPLPSDPRLCLVAEPLAKRP